MAIAVVTTGICACTLGTAPSAINCTSNLTVLAEGKPMGVITDAKGMVNLMPFGLCTSIQNPTVAAATAAAQGKLTPMPCTPMPVAAWIPNQTKVLIGGQPALTLGSICQCSYAGTINIVNPGQINVSTG